MDPGLQMLLQTILNKQDTLEERMLEGFEELNSFKWKITGASLAVSTIVSIVLVVLFH